MLSGSAKSCPFLLLKYRIHLNNFSQTQLLPVKAAKRHAAGRKIMFFRLDTFALHSYLNKQRCWTCRRRDSRFDQPSQTISTVILALDFVSAGPTNQNQASKGYGQRGFALILTEKAF
jgi:hypothetical protein